MEMNEAMTAISTKYCPQWVEDENAANRPKCTKSDMGLRSMTDNTIQ